MRECVSANVCMYQCMCVREREREKETKREKERGRERKREEEREMCVSEIKIWCVCAFVSEWMRESV